MVEERADTGLRERKRRATAHAIEDRAVRLVDEHGYAAVTIEMICEAAEVSRRTFFNYFPSKEDAVLGEPVDSLDPDAVAVFQHAASRDLLGDVVTLAIDSLAATEPSQELVEARMRIMHTDPTLFQNQLARFDRLDEHLCDAICDHFTRYPEARILAAQLGARDEARLLLTLTSAALRHGMTDWLDDPSRDRAELTRSAVHFIRLLSRASP